MDEFGCVYIMTMSASQTIAMNNGSSILYVNDSNISNSSSSSSSSSSTINSSNSYKNITVEPGGTRLVSSSNNDNDNRDYKNNNNSEQGINDNNSDKSSRYSHVMNIGLGDIVEPREITHALLSNAGNCIENNVNTQGGITHTNSLKGRNSNVNGFGGGEFNRTISDDVLGVMSSIHHNANGSASLFNTPTTTSSSSSSIHQMRPPASHRPNNANDVVAANNRSKSISSRMTQSRMDTSSQAIASSYPQMITASSQAIASCSPQMMTASSQAIASRSPQMMTASSQAIASSSPQITASSQAIASCSPQMMTASSQAIASCSPQMMTASSQAIASCSPQMITASSQAIASCSPQMMTASNQAIASSSPQMMTPSSSTKHNQMQIATVTPSCALSTVITADAKLKCRQPDTSDEHYANAYQNHTPNSRSDYLRIEPNSKALPTSHLTPMSRSCYSSIGSGQCGSPVVMNVHQPGIVGMPSIANTSSSSSSSTTSSSLHRTAVSGILQSCDRREETKRNQRPMVMSGERCGAEDAMCHQTKRINSNAQRPTPVPTEQKSVTSSEFGIDLNNGRQQSLLSSSSSSSSSSSPLANYTGVSAFAVSSSSSSSPSPLAKCTAGTRSYVNPTPTNGMNPPVLVHGHRMDSKCHQGQYDAKSNTQMTVLSSYAVRVPTDDNNMNMTSLLPQRNSSSCVNTSGHNTIDPLSVPSGRSQACHNRNNNNNSNNNSNNNNNNSNSNSNRRQGREIEGVRDMRKVIDKTGQRSASSKSYQLLSPSPSPLPLTRRPVGCRPSGDNTRYSSLVINTPDTVPTMSDVISGHGDIDDKLCDIDNNDASDVEDMDTDDAESDGRSQSHHFDRRTPSDTSGRCILLLGREDDASPRSSVSSSSPSLPLSHRMISNSKTESVKSIDLSHPHAVGTPSRSKALNCSIQRSTALSPDLNAYITDINNGDDDDDDETMSGVDDTNSSNETQHQDFNADNVFNPNPNSVTYRRGDIPPCSSYTGAAALTPTSSSSSFTSPKPSEDTIYRSSSSLLPFSSSSSSSFSPSSLTSSSISVLNTRTPLIVATTPPPASTSSSSSPIFSQSQIPNVTPTSHNTNHPCRANSSFIKRPHPSPSQRSPALPFPSCRYNEKPNASAAQYRALGSGSGQQFPSLSDKTSSQIVLSTVPSSSSLSSSSSSSSSSMIAHKSSSPPAAIAAAAAGNRIIVTSATTSFPECVLAPNLSSSSSSPSSSFSSTFCPSRSVASFSSKRTILSTSPSSSSTSSVSGSSPFPSSPLSPSSQPTATTLTTDTTPHTSHVTSASAEIDLSLEKGRRLRARKSRKFLPEKVRYKRQTLQSMTRPLKQWLYRHRGNPYPSKADKTELVQISNMSMTQVSNWFANARRRMKNTSRADEMSWAERIKGYNSVAEGNVELFSIPSDDETDQELLDDVDERDLLEDGEENEYEDGHPDTPHHHRFHPAVCRPLPRRQLSEGGGGGKHINNGSSSIGHDFHPYHRSLSFETGRRGQPSTPSPSPTLTSLISDESVTSSSTTTPPSGQDRRVVALVECPASEEHLGSYPKYKHSILQRYFHDASQQPPAMSDEEMTSRLLRHRHLSSSTGSHDFECLSSSSISSPSHETHPDLFEDFQDDFENMAIRRRLSENGSTDSDELYWKEIGAALALTSLAQAFKK